MPRMKTCTHCATPRPVDLKRQCPGCGHASSRRPDTRARRLMRARVLTRDHGICWLCGQPGADTIDHIVPLSQHGADTDNNLRAAHRSCNSARGAAAA